MAGGLFAIQRQFWLDIGTYDLAMGGWGGEVIILIFICVVSTLRRIWNCRSVSGNAVAAWSSCHARM